jgi:predicted metal-dependent hydrolase
MALSPGAPRNAGSWFLARNREWIRANLPGIRRLIAYVNECSLMPWHERNYEHHKGVIYLADNWRLVYRKKNRSSWKSRPGRRGNETRIRAKFERVP